MRVKKRHLDFVIREDDYRKIVFRFYPKLSHMHSFDENPPKSLNEVYKVYYAWCILQYWKTDDGWRGGERVFYMFCDECSALEYLEEVIRHMIRYKRRKMQALSFGQPGSMWIIRFHPHDVWDENDKRKIDPTNGVFMFEVFDNWTHIGYQFDMELSEALSFCDYLHGVNQHMLENGEAI